MNTNFEGVLLKVFSLFIRVCTIFGQVCARIYKGVYDAVKKRKKDRISFESFWFEESEWNRSLTIEDALNQYIIKYDLSVRNSLNEPALITSTRTKLLVLEESLFSDPENYSDQHLHDYIVGLRKAVSLYDTLSPEALKIMKEKENS